MAGTAVTSKGGPSTTVRFRKSSPPRLRVLPVILLELDKNVRSVIRGEWRGQREFDPAEAIEKALQLFWKRGYHATSMRELVDATGVSRAGLYGEFGSKRDLFVEALAHYRATRVPYMTGFLKPRSGRAGVIAYFEEFIRHGKRDSPGCFVCNTIVEMGPEQALDTDEQINAYLATMQSAAKATLSGEDAAVNKSGLAALVTVIMLGTVVANKTPHGRTMVRSALRSAIQLMKKAN